MERVRETLLFGSPFLALCSKFVTTEEILEYLLYEEKLKEEKLKEEKLKGEREGKGEKKETKTERVAKCVAYRIVCMFSKDQLISGKHFLYYTDNIDYIAIYNLSYPYSDLGLSEKISSNLFRLTKDLEYYKIYNIICETTSKYAKEDNNILAAIRSKHIFRYKDDTNSLLMADYLEPLELSKPYKYLEFMIGRAMYLEQFARNYWNFLFPFYFSFLKKLPTKEIISQFSFEFIQRINSLFPGLIDEKLLKRSSFVFNISRMPKMKKAYILGFPLHLYIPSDSVIEKSLDMLEELGPSKYCQEINKAYEQKFDIKDFKIGNPKDVNFDDFESFNTIDVIHYFTDSEDGSKHLFRFSRPEFKKILKDKKNFYTGEKLPSSVILEIKHRMKIIQSFNLPESKPLIELVKNEEEGVKGDVKRGKGEGRELRDIRCEEGEVGRVEGSERGSELIRSLVRREERRERGEGEERRVREIRDEDIDDEEVIDFGSIRNEDEESDEEGEERYFIGRARNRETGEENFFRMRLPSVQEVDSDEEEDIIADILDDDGLDYLGRATCTCEDCSD